MRARYPETFGTTPQVLYGLSESWAPALHVLPHVGPVFSVAFSPDGSRIVSGSADGTVRTWNTVTGEQGDALEGHKDWVNSVAFSPDGICIASGSMDQTVRIWNTATGEQVALLEGHTPAVMSAAFSHKGDFIASGSLDKTVRIWNMTTYETESLSGEGGVWSVAVSDKYVVSGSDTIVRIWDVATGQLFRELTGPLDEVTSVALSSDSRYIAAACFRELWIWDVDGVIGHEAPSIATGMTSAHVLHDNPQIAPSHSRCLIRNESFNKQGLPMSVAISSDGSWIVSTVGDKEALSGLVYIWCVTTGQLVRSLEGHTHLVTSVAFSPDGSRIASGSSDETVRIWETNINSIGRDDRIVSTPDIGEIRVQNRTETKATRMLGWLSSHSPQTCALSRDGSRLVFGEGNIVYVWNHVTNTVECKLRGHSDTVCSVAISNNGSYVVSGSSDKTVRIWSCLKKKEIARYRHSAKVDCVAFSRDGSRTVFGSRDTMVQIWNPATGQIESKLEVPNVLSVAFSHDGSYVVCGSDKMAWTWNVMTNETKRSSLVSGRLQLPDGTRLRPLGPHLFHLYDPVDQEATNNTPAYLLSITEDRDWIIGEQALHSCWIPPQFRDFRRVSIAESTVCLVSWSGHVLILDLKPTRRD
jgi:WD40 repeat protein